VATNLWASRRQENDFFAVFFFNVQSLNVPLGFASGNIEVLEPKGNSEFFFPVITFQAELVKLFIAIVLPKLFYGISVYGSFPP